MNEAHQTALEAVTGNVMRELESRLRISISERLGRSDWTNEELRGRLIVAGVPNGDTQYLLDGHPILISRPTTVWPAIRPGCGQYLVVETTFLQLIPASQQLAGSAPASLQ